MITAALTGEATGFKGKRVVDPKAREPSHFCFDEYHVLVRKRRGQDGIGVETELVFGTEKHSLALDVECETVGIVQYLETDTELMLIAFGVL
jgi:hypothetical protein